MADALTDDLVKHSVAGGDIFDYQGGGVVNLIMPYMWGMQTALALPTDLPPYFAASTYTYGRDLVLRSTILHESAFWGSAVAIAATKVAAQSFDVKGDIPQRVKNAQSIMVQWGGDGYVASQERGMMDFTCTNNGEFWEIVRTSSAIGSKIIGLVHLDSLRCRRTGDPETPVVFWDLHGRPHDLRAHQVISLVDMPDPSYPLEGIGHCAAERAYPEIYKICAITRYTGEKITGSGAHQIALIQGPTSKQLEDSTSDARQAARAKGLQYFQGTVMIGVPPDGTTAINTLQLRGLPENFQRKEELDIALLAYANALGLVLTDLQPLSGQGLGTGKQAETLEDKARGRGIASRNKQLTHLLNEWVMPDAVTFYFHERDYRDELQQAQIATMRETMRNSMILNGQLQPAQALQMAVDVDDAPREFLPVDQTPDESLGDEERNDEVDEENALPTEPATAPEMSPRDQKRMDANRPEPLGGLPVPRSDVPTKKEKAIDLEAIKAQLINIKEALTA